MIRTPAIVTFANQKGGVGKTTLCLAFANYLLTKGVRVAVADCDPQQSIAKCRTADIRKFGDGLTAYDVHSLDINDAQAMTDTIVRMHNDPVIEVSAVDVPGSLKSPGLVPLLANSDIIVVPFHYDRITVSSTAAFLFFLSRLKESLQGAAPKPRVMMVPNIQDGRVGKRAELLLWEEARETFSRYGVITPKVSKRADMERLSTIAALDMQLSIVSPALDRVYNEIFDTCEPRRKSSLTGVQIYDPKRPTETEQQ